MLSIATRVFSRRLLLLALLACCFFALDIQAQTLGLPAVQLVQSCGTIAGQSCCPGGICYQGLVCNSNNICRTPCGAAGQRCCNGTCNTGLACNANNICRTCGGNGDICCAGNTCGAGLACKGGRCEPCGGQNQPCCGSVCNSAGLACDFTTNTCRVCGFLGTYCCPYAPQCSEGSCKTPGICQ